MRTVIHLLSLELFGLSLVLADFPRRPDLRGLGLSDWRRYAGPLARKLDYTNTFLHQRPRLDITAVDPALFGTLDFLVATEIFEHVAPPVELALANARRLLKPTGVLIASVPYRLTGDNVEHFPELHRYTLVRQNGRRVLRNLARDGREQVFENLVFHGGQGLTLEMRVFSEPGLRACLAEAGFETVTFHGEPYLPFGIYWADTLSLPLVARPAL